MSICQIQTLLDTGRMEGIGRGTTGIVGAPKDTEGVNAHCARSGTEGSSKGRVGTRRYVKGTCEMW